MKDVITSVGIDIGTSTTQLIFSRLTIENRAGSYMVPRVGIVGKEIIYQSAIYETPLKSATEIDAAAVAGIVASEYQKANQAPANIRTGAVIITGETARKQNADEVLAALCEMAGDFVVATAGPDLESALSARGAGADRLSEEKMELVANLDVGGGTTNIAVFEKGSLKGTSCLDIGGRLIRVSDGKISYIFPKIRRLAEAHGIDASVGRRADEAELRRVCDLMAGQIAQAVGLEKRDEGHAAFYTNGGEMLPAGLIPQALTFSGGVADYIYNPEDAAYFRYNDIGVMLGKAVSEYPAFSGAKLYRGAETIRATVVGAGMHSTEISGSTISYAKELLPVKNIPILRITDEEEMSLEAVIDSIQRQIPLYRPEGKIEQIAIAFGGWKHTGFRQIQDLAEALLAGAKEIIAGDYPLIFVIEADIAKALGNALTILLEKGERKKGLICIDGIKTLSGDYIDIGGPIAGGQVVPVITKTLVFNASAS